MVKWCVELFCYKAVADVDFIKLFTVIVEKKSTILPVTGVSEEMVVKRHEQAHLRTVGGTHSLEDTGNASPFFN